MEIELRRLIGHRILIMGPGFVDNDKLQSVKLLAVEEAAIWIESQEAIEKVIGRLQKNLVGCLGLLQSLRANYDHRS